MGVFLRLFNISCIFADKKGEILRANFHTHTNFCDGKDSVEDIVRYAVSQNISCLGFSSHAPLPVPAQWSLLNEQEFEKYVAEIKRNQNEQKENIEIYLGIEADYIPGMTKDFQFLKQQFNLDYVIGAVHLVRPDCSDSVWFIDGKTSYFDKGIELFFGADAKKATQTYFKQIKEMLTVQKFDIIAHFDKIKMNNAERFFSEHDEWYISETEDVLQLLKEKNIFLEVNTRGFYQKKMTQMYPSTRLIKRARELDIPIVISSDAHKKEELLAGFDQAVQIIKQAGYMYRTIRKNNNWVEVQL